MKTFLFIILILSVHTSSIQAGVLDKVTSTFNRFDGFLKRSKGSLNDRPESCGEIDLRKNSIFDKVRSQSTSGWCFAYTDADLISYRINQKISATDIAINFYYNMPEMPREDLLSNAGGGSDIGAISASKGFYCPEEIMPSEDYEIDPSCGATTSDTVTILQKIESLARNRKTLSFCDLSYVKALFPKLSLDSIKEIHEQNINASSLVLIHKFQQANCKEDLIKANIVMRGSLYSEDKVTLDIDRNLEKNNPVSINYNANFLLADDSSFASHYSSIVGRRFNLDSNSCQYLIRNSWGESCEVYPEPYRTNCEKGNIWVDKKLLQEKIINVQFIN